MILCRSTSCPARPVRRVGRPRPIRRPTWRTRATVRRRLRPPSAVAAGGAGGAGGPRTVGTQWTRRRRRRKCARGTRRPRGPRRTTGTAARAARNRPATTVRAWPVAAGAAPRRRTAASVVAATAGGTPAAGWVTSRRPWPWWPRSRCWSCLCWPCRPTTICAVSGHCSATATVRRHRRLLRRRWPAATRMRTGGAAVARPPDGGGDGGGRGATVVDGVAPPGSGRGGTVAGGAGSESAAAVRTVPASPVRCRPATRSTRCPCGWRPADRRPRSIPYPSLYNLSTHNTNRSVINVYKIYYNYVMKLSKTYRNL